MCNWNYTQTVVQIDVATVGIVVILKKTSLPDVYITALGGLTFPQLRWIFSSYTRAKLIATGWPASAVPNSDGNDKTHLYSVHLAPQKRLSLLVLHLHLILTHISLRPS